METATPVLVGSDLHKRFAGRSRQPGRSPGGVVHVTAVDGVSIEVGRQSTHGLVGESGSGKTTVGRLLLKLETADRGSVQLGGDDIGALRGRALQRQRRRMQMVFQDPRGAIESHHRIGSVIAEPMAIHQIGDRESRRARVRELLLAVGLRPDWADRYPHELSGGQLQRVAIARALSVRPEVIVCDEPTSALDVSVQAQILNLLQDLQEQYSLSCLFISHDLSVVSSICDQVSVMYQGRIVEQGEAEAVFASPRHPYTRSLLSSVPTLDPGQLRAQAQPDSVTPDDAGDDIGCRYRGQCPLKTSACAQTDPRLRMVAADHSVACIRVH